MFHIEAIRLISENLRDAVENKPSGREGMALAQYIAGMGFSNVGLGIDHSMAHTLSAHYDTPHGVACAMLLPISMEFNRDYTGERYRAIAKAMGVEGTETMSRRNIVTQPLPQSASSPRMWEFRRKTNALRKRTWNSWQRMLWQMPAIRVIPERQLWNRSLRCSGC